MTTATDATARAIQVTIPMSLCPMSLSKNGRAHWRIRHRDFQGQKFFVELTLSDIREWLPTAPYRAAIMDAEWRYSRGRAPDDANVWARVDPCRDAFESMQVVLDDAHIRTGTVTFTKVSVGSEEVVVTLKREESDELRV